jgi:hypothetical protein
MDYRSLPAALERALDSVAKSEALMASPSHQTLGMSEELLKAACGSLESAGWLDGVPKGGETLAAARELRRAVTRTAKLLQNAFDYHARWALWKGSLAGGYDCDGQAAAYVARGSLAVRG